MTLKHRADDGGPFVRQYRYDDRTITAIDVGAIGDPSFDIVDETIIVVPEGREQIEFDLPDDDAEVFMKNGILTIEIVK